MGIGAKPTQRKRLLIILGIAAVIAIAIALGVGLGIGLHGHGDNDNGNDNGENPTPTGSPLPTPNGTLPWKPSVNESWQIILLSNMILDNDATSVTPNVSIFDIDLFNTPSSTIDTLHRLGKKVICYFSAGSYEPGRPDRSEFKEEDMGGELDGWPGERWLRLSSGNVRRIMKDRIQLASEKGCDGVDPDNVDGYSNQENALDLTEADSVSFLQYLSSLTRPLNLTLGLKNAGDIIPTVLPVVDFSVNEQCIQYSECGNFKPFIDAGKPVFNIEYPDNAGKEHVNTETICSDTGDAEGSERFSKVIKKMDLDGWVEYCDGAVETTAINGTG